LELLLDLLSPLTFNSLRALVAPPRCEFRFQEYHQRGSRRRRIRLAGKAAVQATEELVSLGISNWVEPLPSDQAEWPEAAEWESVEDELENGLPYVKPASVPVECRRQAEARLTDAAKSQFVPEWGLKFTCGTTNFSQGGLVRNRIRVDAVFGLIGQIAESSRCSDVSCFDRTPRPPLLRRFGQRTPTTFGHPKANPTESRPLGMTTGLISFLRVRLYACSKGAARKKNSATNSSMGISRPTCCR
jgi:hypothetical protein